MTSLRAAALAAGLLAAAAAAWAGPAPGASRVSPDGPVDLDQLLQVTRLREAMTAKLVYSYTYRLTTTEEQFDADGKLRRRSTAVYQVVPTPQGEERQLLSKDGEEPTEAEIRKQERRNESLQRRFEKMRERAQRDAERERRLREKTAPPTGPARATPAAPVSRPTHRPAPATASAPASVPAAATSGPAASAPGVAAPASAPVPAQVPPARASTPATAPAAVPRPAAPPLAPLPPCDLDDPTASVRPPLPGSVVTARVPGPASSEEARRRRERTSDYSLFELLNMTDHEYAGACTWDARPMHVVRFKPPSTFDPLNPVERVATAMAGTLLIDASDMEVARAAGTTVAPITWGAGMVKLKSARVMYEYGRVHGETWLPRRDVFEIETRVVFDSDHVRWTREFDDFLKAEVGVEVEYGEPVE